MEKKMMTMRWWSRPWRLAKTLFFLLSMLASLLFICAPPLLVVILDLVIPPSLLSAAPVAAGSSNFFAPARLLKWKSFGFRSSLIDLPLMSAARSLLILCAYIASEGHQEVYLWFTTLCSSASIAYAMLKAVGIYAAAASSGGKPRLFGVDGRDGVAIEFLFLSSLGLAIGHIVAAYQTSCRERRKQIVYRIDVEAVKLKGNQIKISIQ